MEFAQRPPYPQTVDHIKDIVHRVLDRRRHPEIAWIGLAGSFARDQQDANSDVDLVVGYSAPGQANQVWDVRELTIDFEMLCKRAFDVVYIKDGEIRSWDKAIGAFLNSTTIFERDPNSGWLIRNRRLAASALFPRELNAGSESIAGSKRQNQQPAEEGSKKSE
jgi:predicted nucleotidyltransferase